jgi:hypothetical protein
MPVAVLVAGSATAGALADLLGDGSGEVYVESPDCLAGGSATVDRTTFVTLSSGALLVGVEVILGGDLVNVADEITITRSLDSAVVHAEFTVVDPRVSRWARGSYSDGDFPVTIDVYCGTPGSVLKRRRFSGHTEGCTISGTYNDRGQFHAVSDSSGWADNKGCLRVAAMAGYRRGQLLALFAASAGQTIVAPPGGRVVMKPIDEKQKTPWQLIQEWGQAEGWLPRLSIEGSALEIISEDTLLDGSPKVAFDGSNMLERPTEATPTRPRTALFLSGTGIPEAAPGSTPDTGTSVSETPTDDGKIVTTITKDQGVEVYRKVETYSNVYVPGETNSDPFVHLIRVDEIESTWALETFYSATLGLVLRPTTQLLKRVTRVKEETGVPVAVDYTVTFAWEDGGLWASPGASLIETGRITDEYTWDTPSDPGRYQAGCGLLKQVTTSFGLYAPLVDPVAVGAHQYADGSWRYGDHYTLIQVGKETSQWFDYRDVGADPYVQNLARIEGYRAVGKAASPNETMNVEGWALTTQIVRTWRGNAANTAGNLTTEKWFTDGVTPGVRTVEPYVGQTPGPPKGSTATPQYVQQLITAEVDDTDASHFTRREDAPGALTFAEDADELVSIGRRILRREQSMGLTWSSPVQWDLREGDHVTVLDRRDEVRHAYVWTLQEKLAVLNGRYVMSVTAKIPSEDV